MYFYFTLTYDSFSYFRRVLMPILKVHTKNKVNTRFQDLGTLLDDITLISCS